ncbi:metal-dependent hydrolase [Sansalvadorimonas sp. 2012CJ34-2]|uniref:Metal-dependent hydrolase n=1 Tax=Parendozoicomonas callyspongiae TaxID=2942213 RepID=A0ABT0PC22_9GAMM|nr:metal-dependent hydrolase [Sansalvadorimonas sp. 2012CJ34-2]MCL6268771.1 metal-dependent hydrolase [Sansalvadorimonas sp. 2012CJ34-2]
MADFRTHFTTACTVSGIFATTALYTGEITLIDTVLIWGTGTFGGLLPDIDSDNSITLTITSTLLAAIIAIGLGGYLASRVPLAHNLALITAVLWFFRGAVIPFFARITVHRGNWHSLSAAFLFAFCITNCSYHFFEKTASFSFLLGLNGGIGFITHLFLDEIFAINLASLKLKRSFGTALKLWDFSSPCLSTLLLALCAVQIYYLPGFQPLESIISKLLETTKMGLG